MYRSKFKKLKPFIQDNIKIEPLDYIFEEYVIGNWNIFYDDIKLVYNNNYDPNNNYAYVIKINNTIVGYFICDYKTNLETNQFINKFESKLVVLEFAIYNKAYIKLGKLLLAHLKKLAFKLNVSLIEIKKIEGFERFYKLINKQFKTYEDELNYYVKIKSKVKTKFLPNINDQISYENLSFLHGLKFRIYKNICKYENNDLKISVNRLTNSFSLNSNTLTLHDIELNDYSRNLIYYLILKSTKNEVFDYNVDIHDNLHIYKDNKLVLLHSISKLATDYKTLNQLYKDGIDNIKFIHVSFDSEYQYYNDEIVDINILTYLNNRTIYLDNKKTTLKESMISFNNAKKFNECLKDLVKFRFEMGNSFSGIKKFQIEFEDEIIIKSNGDKLDSKIEYINILNDLANLYFYNWKSNYNDNPNPNLDNAWKITLTFKDNILEYQGLDDYPNVWFYLINFLSKYVDLKLRKNYNE